jgi:hypothetical protein
MKFTLLPAMLLASTPVFAGADCKTVANDVVYHDHLFKTQARYFTDRYGDINPPPPEDPAQRRDFLNRLNALINTVQGDIDGMRWLIDHHCGPAKEEPEAIASVHEMDEALKQMTLLHKKILEEDIVEEIKKMEAR